MFIKVYAENFGQVVEILVEPEGHVLLGSITAKFPGACGLRYKAGDVWRGVSVNGEKLIPGGGDTWMETLIYIATFPKASSQDASAAKKDTDESLISRLQKVEKDLQEVKQRFFEHSYQEQIDLEMYSHGGDFLYTDAGHQEHLN